MEQVIKYLYRLEIRKIGKIYAAPETIVYA